MRREHRKSLTAAELQVAGVSRDLVVRHVRRPENSRRLDRNFLDPMSISDEGPRG